MPEFDDSLDDTNRRFMHRRGCSSLRLRRPWKEQKEESYVALTMYQLRYVESQDVAIVWLTKIFNHTFWSTKVPEGWRKSILVPIFKNKRCVQSCTTYQCIKLMIHTTKLWGRVIEHCSRRMTNVTKNQFGFMPERSTTEAISLLHQLIERYKE
jgi:hypothetical protein